MATTTSIKAEREAVTHAVLDYFEGWFEGDVERMKRALHPQLAKRSLGGNLEALDNTTAEWMIDATARGVGKSRLEGRDDPQIYVAVEDLYDTIANVTVRSAIYREYLQLVRTRTGWKIVNALWQRTLEASP